MAKTNNTFDEFKQTGGSNAPQRENYEEFLKSLGKFSEQAKVETEKKPEYNEFDHFKIEEYNYDAIDEDTKIQEIKFDEEHDVNEIKPRGEAKIKKFIENSSAEDMLLIAVTELLKPKFPSDR